jgi:hypothetical protein
VPVRDVGTSPWCASGLVSHAAGGTFIGNGSGVSRGDRNRNGRLERLRVLVPVTNAIVGIDLADVKQMIVVTDHDSKVLAGKTFRCRAWDLGEALDWSAVQARAGGFCRATVACERLATGGGPGQLASVRGVPLVCVQPMLTSWARRSEDLAFDKTDEKDAVLIARLTAQLDDWRQTQRRLADTETRMTRVLDDLQLTEPATLMTGLSPVGAAAILAETGDPRRFATGRALARHAGLGAAGETFRCVHRPHKLTGQGRPGLRLAAWRRPGVRSARTRFTLPDSPT